MKAALLSCVILGCSAQSPWPPHDNSTADCGHGVTCYPCKTGPPAASPTKGCSIGAFHNNSCFSNRKGIVSNLNNIKTAKGCCQACSSNSKCTSWTFWDKTKCNLFSTTIGLHDGNCTSGSGPVTPTPPTPGPAPTPAPSPVPPPGPACTDCPNILLMFTDDQDLTIGGWDLDKGVMVQAQRMVGDLGATSTNWMIHTPICAPSRAELLSGRYLHNIKSDNKSPSAALCGSGAVGQIDLEKKVYPFTFVEKLRVEKGYATGQVWISSARSKSAGPLLLQQAPPALTTLLHSPPSCTHHPPALSSVSSKTPTTKVSSTICARSIASSLGPTTRGGSTKTPRVQPAASTRQATTQATGPALLGIKRSSGWMK
jgi:hypothetical protein